MYYANSNKVFTIKLGNWLYKWLSRKEFNSVQ